MRREEQFRVILKSWSTSVRTTVIILPRVLQMPEQRPQLSWQHVDLQAVEQPALCLVAFPSKPDASAAHWLQVAELWKKRTKLSETRSNRDRAANRLQAEGRERREREIKSDQQITCTEKPMCGTHRPLSHDSWKQGQTGECQLFISTLGILQMQPYMLTRDSSVSLYEAHKWALCTFRHSISNGVHPLGISNQYLDQRTINTDSPKVESCYMWIPTASSLSDTLCFIVLSFYPYLYE